jgi:cation:H+ antiporter
MIGAGIALHFFGASLTVDNAVTIARATGVSERVVGLTIVAVGTSLPELITSIVAAMKRHHDISIGNIVGSNIYNILAIVGLSAAISGITVNPLMATDYAVMIAFSAALLPLLKTGFVVSRIEGITLVAAYAGYLAYIVAIG